MTKAKFDRQKASRIYELNIAEVNERHNKEIKDLAAKLSKSGMLRQGPGYSAFEDLALKQIKESATIYVASLLSTLDEKKKVDKGTEQELIDMMVSFLNRLVEMEKMHVRTRLAADNITGGLAKEKLSVLPRRSLEIRRYLTNKINVEIDNRNANVKTGLSSFWQTFKRELPKTLGRKFATFIWTSILVILSFILGWLIRGCEK